MRNKIIDDIAQEIVITNKLIKEKTEQLRGLKKDLEREMDKNGIKNVILANNKISKVKSSSIYSTSLEKEFYNLSQDKINELISSGLIKVSFRLDTKKYQEYIEANQVSIIDGFVKKRPNDSYLRVS
tara:strand:+ start:165 stop:545 length:381 start_codon:yes stop_codon:yes gene_type:complete